MRIHKLHPKTSDEESDDTLPLDGENDRFLVVRRIPTALKIEEED